MAHKHIEAFVPEEIDSTILFRVFISGIAVRSMVDAQLACAMQVLGPGGHVCCTSDKNLVLTYWRAWNLLRFKLGNA